MQKIIDFFFSESQSEELSYVTLLKDWQITPSRLKVLNKTLGAGQFGSVKLGLYYSGSGDDPKHVAVKMLKGTKLSGSNIKKAVADPGSERENLYGLILNSEYLYFLKKLFGYEFPKNFLK